MMIRSSVGVFSCAALFAAAADAQDLFDATRVVAGPGFFRVVADVDGDSDLDLIGGQRQPNQALGWINDGAGEFTQLQFVAAVRQEWNGDMAVLDFTGDGIVDVACAVFDWHPLGGGLLVYPGLGGASFGAAPQHLATSGTPFVLHQDDINGDGVPDLLLGLTANQPFVQQVQWLVSSPAGHVAGSAPTSVSTIGQLRRDFVVDDWDNDGTPDLLRRSPAGAEVFLTVGTTLSSGGLLSAPNFPAGTLAPIDLDGDGDRDFVVYGQISGSTYRLTAILNDGAGGFSSALLGSGTAISGQVLGHVEAVDWDLDGDQDLFVRTDPQGPSPNACLMFENDGTGQFELVRAVPIGAADADWAIGFHDLNSDGLPDLVGGAEYLLGTGRIEVDSDVSFATESGKYHFDVDRDGDPDYLWPTGAVYLHNDGAGATGLGVGSPSVMPFVPPPSQQAHTNFRGDLNGDGLLDCVCAVGRTHRTYYGSPDLMLHDQGLTFPSVFKEPDAEGALAADLDGDGILDLAMGDGIGFGNGDGTFRMVYNTWPGHSVNAIADLNGDGVLDVQTVRYQNTSFPVDIGWWIGVGPAAYIPQIISEPGIERRAVGLGDVDGDGLNDLVYVRQGTQVELVVRTNTAGVFGAPIVLPVPGLDRGSVRGIAIEGLDGDGLSDLAVWGAGYRANRLAVLRNQGSSFSAPQLYVGYNGTALYDVDGDGDLDFVGESVTRSLVHQGLGAGARIQYGTGTDVGGFVPVLGATGPFRSGSTMVLRARNFPGGSPMLIAFGGQRSNLPDFLLPGITSYVWPWLASGVFPVTGGTPGVPGEGTFDVSVPLLAVFANTTLMYQAAFLDPAGPSGLSVTNGLEITHGN